MKKKLPKSKVLRSIFPPKRWDVMVFAFLISILILTSVAAIIYRYSPLWSPFRLVEAQSKNFGQAVKVVFESNIPVKARIEYGTSNVYLNATEESTEYKTRHEVYVASVLPDRRHYIKVVGQTPDGKIYESAFFTVE